jgi:hypothetical protein
MKVTKENLRKIITEEVQRALLEVSPALRQKLLGDLFSPEEQIISILKSKAGMSQEEAEQDLVRALTTAAEEGLSRDQAIPVYLNILKDYYKS